MLTIRDLLETAKLKSMTLTFANKRLEHIYLKHDLIRLVYAFESVIGVIMTSLYLVTLSRKMIRD